MSLEQEAARAVDRARDQLIKITRIMGEVYTDGVDAGRSIENADHEIIDGIKELVAEWYNTPAKKDVYRELVGASSILRRIGDLTNCA